jgi:peptide/nickel transport system substrate-binding protein
VRLIAPASFLAVALLLTACTSGNDTPPAGGSGETGEYVSGATLAMGLVSDPGSLDPHTSASSVLYQVASLAYDSLVGLDGEGQILPQLAESWILEGDTVTFALRDDVTCSDGSSFKPSTAAANIEWIADPNNASPFLGVFVPGGTVAEADDDAGTLTLTLATNAPFLMEGLSQLLLVCDAGLADRSLLDSGTVGSGLFRLTEAVAQDHYTFELNPDYAWGPGDVTAKTPGLPAEVQMRVVPNETTAANLLLAGELNIAQVLGQDRERLLAADVDAKTLRTVVGEQVHNESEGHPTADPKVRMALTQALDFEELRQVITSGVGLPTEQLAVLLPSGCHYDSVSANLPKTDVAAAEAGLDSAGWEKGADGMRAKDGQPLKLTFIYDTALGTAGSAAADLAVEQWAAIGVDIQASGLDNTQVMEALFQTGAWDITWVGLNVANPDQVVGFFSGPPAPEGTNFAGIANSDYEAKATEAMGLMGAESCPVWEEAEGALIRDADVVPFADNLVHTFVDGVDFTVLGRIEPATLRMLAK